MIDTGEAFHRDVKRLVAMMPAAVRFSAVFGG
jgi:hypothetical protein